MDTNVNPINDAFFDSVATSPRSDVELASRAGQIVALNEMLGVGYDENEAELVELVLSNADRFGEGPQEYIKAVCGATDAERELTLDGRY